MLAYGGEKRPLWGPSASYGFVIPQLSHRVVLVLGATPDPRHRDGELPAHFLILCGLTSHWLLSVSLSLNAKGSSAGPRQPTAGQTLCFCPRGQRS